MNIHVIRSAVIRLLLSLVIAFFTGAVISEISYRLTGNQRREVNESFTLLIPNGTAERIASGQRTPDIPESLTFIEGDTLFVKNEDTVSHQLGPIWVPPGTTGKLSLGSANLYSYSCSFQPTQYLGLNVEPRMTNWIRFQGIVTIGLPSGVMLWLYSLLLYPLGDKKVEVEV